MMEVSMLSAPSAKVNTAPPVPTPPRPPVKSPEPKKVVTKPIPKKVTPTVQQPAETAPAQPVSAQPIATEAPSNAATENKQQESPVTEQFTEANYKASYLHNPAPEYPSIARSRGWQGKVKLRVHVSAEGLSEGIEVVQSSGHDTLDDAAIETVKKFKFIPAKRGSTAVSSSVVVPIDFHMDGE